MMRPVTADDTLMLEVAGPVGRLSLDQKPAFPVAKVLGSLTPATQIGKLML